MFNSAVFIEASPVGKYVLLLLDESLVLPTRLCPVKEHRSCVNT
jgi:hypothetical protein